MSLIKINRTFMLIFYIVSVLIVFSAIRELFEHKAYQYIPLFFFFSIAYSTGIVCLLKNAIDIEVAVTCGAMVVLAAICVFDIGSLYLYGIDTIQHSEMVIGLMALICGYRWRYLKWLKWDLTQLNALNEHEKQRQNNCNIDRGECD